MSNFQPPPTWAELLLVDEKTNKAAFNPIWLNWFIGLVQNIPASGSVGSVTATSPLASSGGASPNISIASSTGTGAVVLATSPTLVTPNIGVATGSVPAGTLTGATLAAGVTASSLLTAGASFAWGTGTANFGTFAARKTADETVVSSAVLQNDDHLVLPIAAGEEWETFYCISCGANLSAATGVKVAVTTPAGATQEISFALLNALDTSTTGQTGRTTTSGGQMSWAPADISAGGTHSLLIGMASVFNAGTAGNVQLQWAQQTSSVTSLIFRKGSFMRAVRTT